MKIKREINNKFNTNIDTKSNKSNKKAKIITNSSKKESSIVPTKQETTDLLSIQSMKGTFDTVSLLINNGLELSKFSEEDISHSLIKSSCDSILNIIKATSNKLNKHNTNTTNESLLNTKRKRSYVKVKKQKDNNNSNNDITYDINEDVLKLLNLKYDTNTNTKNDNNNDNINDMTDVLNISLIKNNSTANKDKLSSSFALNKSTGKKENKLNSSLVNKKKNKDKKEIFSLIKDNHKVNKSITKGKSTVIKNKKDTKDKNKDKSCSNLIINDNTSNIICLNDNNTTNLNNYELKTELVKNNIVTFNKLNSIQNKTLFYNYVANNNNEVIVNDDLKILIIDNYLHYEYKKVLGKLIKNMSKNNNVLHCNCSSSNKKLYKANNNNKCSGCKVKVKFNHNFYCKFLEKHSEVKSKEEIMKMINPKDVITFSDKRENVCLYLDSKCDYSRNYLI